MKSLPNEIRVVLFDVGGVLVELSGLAMLLSWLKNRITPEQALTFVRFGVWVQLVVL